MSTGGKQTTAVSVLIRRGDLRTRILLWSGKQLFYVLCFLMLNKGKISKDVDCAVWVIGLDLESKIKFSMRQKTNLAYNVRSR